MVGLAVLVGLLMVAGIAGSFVPFLPGAPLILLGAFFYALATEFTPVGTGRLVALLLLTVLSYAIDYIAGGLGARKLGGSRWAMAGAVAGALVGLFFGPVGVLIGPVIGGMALELLHRKELRASLRGGLGVAIGMMIGMVAKLSIAVGMVGLFTFWVFHG